MGFSLFFFNEVPIFVIAKVVEESWHLYFALFLSLLNIKATLTTQRKNSHLNVSDEGPRSSAAHKHAARSIQKPATKKRASRGR